MQVNDRWCALRIDGLTFLVVCKARLKTKILTSKSRENLEDAEVFDLEKHIQAEKVLQSTESCIGLTVPCQVFHTAGNSSNAGSHQLRYNECYGTTTHKNPEKKGAHDTEGHKTLGREYVQHQIKALVP